MNILYCGDQGIERGVLISILSLLMRSPQSNIYHIYIATISYHQVTPFRTQTATFLDQLVKQYNPRSFVKLIDATTVFTKHLPTKNMSSYFTPCSMLRLYIDKIPTLAKLDRILYLDYDVIARQDISEFYHMPLDGIEAAGVLDIYGRRWYHYHGLFVQDYMNSGVMLFNVPECLKTNMFETAVQLCATRKMLLADQSALNQAIQHRQLVDRKYNEQEDRPRQDTVLHHFSNNFKFWPYFRVQKVKPFEIDKVHRILKITEYDDILDQYRQLKDRL